ncbi:MAG TPA: Spy/CpxP family protein refolding chaperone [Burkholderiales bacterium]
MKRILAVTAIAAALSIAPASAQQGMTPGMMGGQGMGGMMGPGMMGGQGMGGMMGPGMMGGQGMGGMMGPGMMGGLGYLNLSDDQRQKIGEIQQEVSRKHWDLMAKMHEQQYRMHELESGKTDDAEARKAYAAMSASHKQMFDTMLDARKRIDAVLTKEQREQMRRGMRGGMGKH